MDTTEKENRVIRFQVLGDPIALKRHRHFKTKTGNIVNVDPNSDDKLSFADAVQRHAPKEVPTCPVKMSMTFAFTRPKSHFGTGRNEGKLKGSAPQYHTKRPDLDNLVKFVKDSLNGIFWKDDSQVVAFGQVIKYYGVKQALTTVEIEYIE